MIAKVEKRGGYWYGFVIDDDGEALYTSKMERRAGCAFRSLLNGWQSMHGAPETTSFVLEIDEW